MCLGWPRWTRAGPYWGLCLLAVACGRHLRCLYSARLPVCPPCSAMALPSGIDRLSNKVGSPTEGFVHARAPWTMRRHVGRRLAGQEGACG